MSGVSREVNGPTSPGNETPPSVLEQENNDLLNRIAEVQQEKWNLEEKVGRAFFSRECFYVITEIEFC